LRDLTQFPKQLAHLFAPNGSSQGQNLALTGVCAEFARQRLKRDVYRAQAVRDLTQFPKQMAHLFAQNEQDDAMVHLRL